VVPKGTRGQAIAMTQRIRSLFPGLIIKPDGELVLVEFPGLPECLVPLRQLVVNP
jgi:hypothetical protein